MFGKCDGHHTESSQDMPYEQLARAASGVDLYRDSWGGAALPKIRHGAQGPKWNFSTGKHRDSLLPQFTWPPPSKALNLLPTTHSMLLYEEEMAPRKASNQSLCSDWKFDEKHKYLRIKKRKQDEGSGGESLS